MKKILIILLAIVSLSASKRSIKKQLNEVKSGNKELEILISKLVNASDVVTLDYPCDKSRKDIKYALVHANMLERLAKLDAKRLIAESKQETKQEKNDNRTEIKTDWFLNLMEGMTRMVAMAIAGGFMGGGVLITKLIQFFTK